MRKILDSFIIFLVFCCSVVAQDARQRTVETIVQDVLAALPADNMSDCYIHMADLAKSAPSSIEKLGAMLKPAGEGEDNLVEYAISGVVRYATDPANESVRAVVKEGLEKALAVCGDRYDRQFLESQLRLMAPYRGTFEDDMKIAFPLDEADELYRSGKSNEMCKALWLYVDSLGVKSMKKILKALKSDDRAVRTTALRAYASFADDAFYSRVVKMYGKLSEDARVDVLSWIGENEIASQFDFVLSQMCSGGKTGAAAIEAVASMGGDKAVDALLSVPVTEENFESLHKALKYVDADIDAGIIAALPQAEGLFRDLLVTLSGEKRIYGTSMCVMKLAREGNACAMSSLKGVVKASDFASLAEMMDNEPSDEVHDAMCAAVKPLSSSEIFAVVRTAAESASDPELFYRVMALAANEDAVNYLKRKYEEGSDVALSALTGINDISVAPVLFKVSDRDERYLMNYVDVISANEPDEGARCEAYIQALSKAADTDVRKYVIAALGTVPTMRAFNEVKQYIDDSSVSYAAASALRSIASRNAVSIDYYLLKDGLEKAADVFRASSGADDGYAVDEIGKILDSVKPYEIYRLSEEEQKLGYEILFDGTDLSAWTGDKVGYTAVNGCINVTASYGDTKNLYTVKEYSDFILRFEFCFEKPGVNNGVGIRTPMGVDAAYFGMCEVQVLDHDAPIYAGLKPYQVHGSVYGIVPAKRIVHKPLGEWSTMEIKVVGDSITVTVNGEVINEADVRKASRNGTIDSREHPGIFNRKGHIGFLGHGAGLKYRNVRILELM